MVKNYLDKDGVRALIKEIVKMLEEQDDRVDEKLEDFYTKEEIDGIIRSLEQSK